MDDKIKENESAEFDIKDEAADTAPKTTDAETKEEIKESAAKSQKETESKTQKSNKKEENKLKGETENLAASLSEITDKYTRMLAEYDNFRKRAAKERDGIYTDACSDVLSEILPVKDSLELALKFADESKLSQGVTMTLTKFTEILKRLGVEEFGALGDTFDPLCHNAVLHVEDEELGENVIAEVLLKGYKKGDKIIRYAMVKVAN